MEFNAAPPSPLFHDVKSEDEDNEEDEDEDEEKERRSKEGGMNQRSDWDGMLVRLMETSCFSFCLLLLCWWYFFWGAIMLVALG